MPKMPTWKVPKDLAKTIEKGDGTWEDARWSPMLLTAMSGTELEGRAIPVAWQIEFDPFDDELAAVNERLEEGGVEVDGYGWGEHIRKVVREVDAGLAERLRLTDCEMDTCVVWVESEEDCRKVSEVVWKVMHGKG